MAIDLYSYHMSPFCRSVLCTLKELGISYNLKNIDLSEQEQFNPDFLKINPAHLIPTIVDDGLVLWESRAVMQYLCNKYAPESTLYPKDHQKRAVVDRWLNFDVTLLNSAKFVLFDVNPPEEKLVAFKNNMKLMDELIGDKKYLTGDYLTIADLSVLANTQFVFHAMSKVDLTEYPNFKRWTINLQTTLPYFSEILMSATPDQFQAFVTKSKDYLMRKFNEI